MLPAIALLLPTLCLFLFADRWVARYTGGTDAFRKMFYLVSGALFLMFFIAFYLLKVRAVRLEVVFLLTGLILGMTYSLLVPPIAAPDESYHLGFVYAEAEKLNGWDTNEYFDGGSVGTQYLRQEEAEHGLRQDGIDHAYYTEFFSRLLEREQTDALTELRYSNNHEVPHLLYVPAALGVNLGRALHLGAVPTLMLGRFFNLLVFLAAGFYALRRVPFGKELLYAATLLPMTLQEVDSFSCDSMILAMAFLMIALSLHFAYHDIVWKKENGRLSPAPVIDAVLLIGTSALLSRCKYGACVPLCLLLWLIFLRKKKSDRKLAFGAVLLFVLDLVAGFFPSLYRTFHSVVLENTAAPNYTIGDLLRDPLNIFRVLGNTINRYTDHYLFSTVGTSLGWYTINVPLFLGALFFLALFLLLLRERGSARIERASEKWLLGTVCVLGVLTAAGGMLIGNTPRTSAEIIGLQGRYFLPYLPLLLLLLVPKRIYLTGENASYSRTILLFILVLQFAVVMNLFLRAY